jgi:hypothetical protein
MAEPAISALIVRVDAAEPLVGALRQRYDENAPQGLPPHVTVLVPFMPPQHIDDAVLRRLRTAVAGVPAFDFSCARLGRWPETAYLVPEPPAPFIALTRAVWAAFPEFPPYEGRYAEIAPHLTVGCGTTADAVACERELAPRLAAHGPVVGRCEEVELIENSRGRWHTMQRLPLG